MREHSPLSPERCLPAWFSPGCICSLLVSHLLSVGPLSGGGQGTSLLGSLVCFLIELLLCSFLGSVIDHK